MAQQINKYQLEKDLKAKYDEINSLLDKFPPPTYNLRGTIMVDNGDGNKVNLGTPLYDAENLLRNSDRNGTGITDYNRGMKLITSLQSGIDEIKKQQPQQAGRRRGTKRRGTKRRGTKRRGTKRRRSSRK